MSCLSQLQVSTKVVINDLWSETRRQSGTNLDGSGSCDLRQCKLLVILTRSLLSAYIPASHWHKRDFSRLSSGLLLVSGFRLMRVMAQVIRSKSVCCSCE